MPREIINGIGCYPNFEHGSRIRETNSIVLVSSLPHYSPARPRVQIDSAGC